MKPSQDLHDLIHSLTPAEKRYFKLFSSLNNKQGKNAYVKVFEVIEKQEVYNEPAVISAAGGEKLARQYPVVKNYLHKLILKSLRNFHSGQSVDFRLKEWLMNVEILLRKDLISQCIKQLDKARAVAIEYEKYEYLLEILNYNLSLAVKVSQVDLDQLNEDLEEIFRDADAYFDKFKNILTHKKLSMQMLVLNRKEQHLRSDYSLSAYTSLMDHPITRGLGTTKSIKAKAYYLQSLYIFHFAKSEYDVAYLAGIAMVELMEKNPFLVEERPGNYLTALQNMVTMAVPTQPAELALEKVGQLKNFKEKFPRIRFGKNLEYKAILFAYYQHLSILLNKKDFQAGLELSDEIVAWLDAQKITYNLNEGFVVIGMHFNMAKTALYAGQFRKALRLVNTILDHPGIGSGYNLYLAARLMQVILYLELGENSLLESATISVYRFLEKRKKLHRFEKVLMKYIKRLQGLYLGDPEMLEILHSMEKEMKKALSNDPFGQNALQQFDFMDWLANKIQVLSSQSTSPNK